MPKAFKLDIYGIQPSQLYISKKKLSAVFDWLKKGNDYCPIPVKLLNGNIIYTDGHTRALALYKLGIGKLQVYWDTDDLDREAYQICVDWCKKEGITKISHLEHRIIDHEQYAILWYDRCRKMQAELKKKRFSGS